MHDDDESDLQNMKSGITEKNTRHTVEAGTYCVSVVVPINRKPFTDASRLQAELRGRSAVLRAFRAKWPEVFRWDDCQFVVAHVTMQVIVELSIKP